MRLVVVVEICCVEVELNDDEIEIEDEDLLEEDEAAADESVRVWLGWVIHVSRCVGFLYVFSNQPCAKM